MLKNGLPDLAPQPYPVVTRGLQGPPDEFSHVTPNRHKPLRGTCTSAINTLTTVVPLYGAIIFLYLETQLLIMKGCFLINHGLLYAIVAHYFGLLGFPGMLRVWVPATIPEPPTALLSISFCLGWVGIMSWSAGRHLANPKHSPQSFQQS